ncbi:IS3 family transposase [Diaphorobacter aerolatus]|uniref:IS3 family transposase n=1 Tax=Diaphorobacter aerolatus TaxID=1288495 RepID=A0A7H0GLR6_9BURK|nr:IS3 family transposase [Diaphorobacter aerolatus]QNP49232.1 IS3 family transposase [Diaphorobacter aerolatus]
MSKTVRARYTLEFKQEAVRLVKGGQSIAAAARTLGLVEQTLFNWVKADRLDTLTGAGGNIVSAEQMEISRLRAELARVKMERDILGKSDGVLREGAELKYAFIHRNRRMWPISVQCRVLQASIAGYHEHFARCVHGAQRLHLSDDAVLVHIKAIHAETHGSYGWPRTCKALQARGIRVGKERVRRLMQLHGIRAKGKRRFKVTTNSNHGLPVAPNVLDRQFDVGEPNRVWVSDITYISTDEGWLFLAVVIDLFSRQVVGWSLREDMTRNIVIDALRMAWFKRHPDKNAGLIFHSDRGSQYASEDFRQVLTEYGITASMSRRANCWDNACSETLFGSLKVERLHGQRFVTRRQAKDEVIDWMLWYNHSRLHSTLAHVSPMQFEKDWHAAQARQAHS